MLCDNKRHSSSDHSSAVTEIVSRELKQNHLP